MKFHDVELDLDYRERRLKASAISQKLRRELKKKGITQCKCEACKGVYPLSFTDLHHVDPIAEGGRADGIVVTVCRKCHYNIHGKEYDPKSIIIDEEEWLLYALQNKNQKEIAEERDCSAWQVNRAWEKFSGRGISWPQYKTNVHRGII